MLKLTFHGGAKMVTGANYLLETESPRSSASSPRKSAILIDCGLHQGSNFCEKHNWEPFAYDPKTIDAVFITHAHIDHTGRLPKLVKDGFRGTVYSTAPTRDASELLLRDSDHILAQEAERFKKPILYNAEDIDQLMRQWQAVEYHKPIVTGDMGQGTGMTVTFWNAGHILGSSFIEIKVDPLVNSGRAEKLVFSGDLGNSPAPIIGPWEVYGDDATYCIVESTYGDRVHEQASERVEILEHLIQDTAVAGGTLLIPAFAMERTQELLYEINNMAEHGRIPKIPIFLDSPLAIKLTDVYKKYSRYFDAEAQRAGGRDGSIFDFPGLTRTLTTEESKQINEVKGPKVVIAGSGMSHGGRILHHEKRYLPDPKSTFLIVGYQAQGSLGRQILEGAKAVRIHGEDIPVRCHVKAIGAYSAHADQPQLLEWLRPMRTTLKKAFAVQGEEGPATALAQKISDELAVHSYVPSLGEEVML